MKVSIDGTPETTFDVPNGTATFETYKVKVWDKNGLFKGSEEMATFPDEGNLIAIAQKHKGNVLELTKLILVDTLPFSDDIEFVDDEEQLSELKLKCKELNVSKCFTIIGGINMDNGCCKDEPVIITGLINSVDGKAYYSCQCACGGWCTGGHNNISDAVREYELMSKK